MTISCKAIISIVLLASIVFNVLETAPSIDYAVRPDVVCRMSKAVGICKAYLVRWRYNPETRKCEEFIYGGCKGNGNNFEEEEDCLAVCRGI